MAVWSCPACLAGLQCSPPCASLAQPFLPQPSVMVRPGSHVPLCPPCTFCLSCRELRQAWRKACGLACSLLFQALAATDTQRWHSESCDSRLSGRDSAGRTREKRVEAVRRCPPCRAPGRDGEQERPGTARTEGGGAAGGRGELQVHLEWRCCPWSSGGRGRIPAGATCGSSVHPAGGLCSAPPSTGRCHPPPGVPRGTPGPRPRPAHPGTGVERGQVGPSSKSLVSCLLPFQTAFLVT